MSLRVQHFFLSSLAYPCLPDFGQFCFRLFATGTDNDMRIKLVISIDTEFFEVNISYLAGQKPNGGKQSE
jgi:hypothetical protein